MRKPLIYFLVIAVIMSLMSGCSFKRISPEEDIINMQMGGYLYTSMVRADTKDERAFLKARSKAVDKMVSVIEKTAKYSFNLTDGLEKYEDNLLKYIEKIKDPDITSLDIINSIVEKIIAYKVILESYEEEIRQYMKMNPDGNSVEAIMNTYQLAAICNLVDVQNEYLSWLTVNTASIVTILEETSERQAGKLISSSESLYGKQIEETLINMLEQFELASIINSSILSADYYVSSIYLDETAANIELIKSGKANAKVSVEELSNLESMYNDTVNSITVPTVLKPIPKEEASFSLTRRVSAIDELPLGFNMVASMLEFYTTLSIREMAFESEPSVSKETFAETLEESQTAIKDTPGKMTEAIEKKPIGTAPLSKDAKNTQKTADQQSADRIKMIAMIYAGQKVIGITSIWKSTDEQYATVVEQISKIMAEGGSKLSDEDRQNAMDLIKSGMDELIGGNKEEFIDLIKNQTATELYETFIIWKDSIENIKTHEFTKEDLKDLLILMGVDISIEPLDDTVAENPTTTPTQNTPSPTPTATPDSVESNLPTDSTETTDNFGIVHITGFWQTIRELDPYLDNESILYTIYGWTDLLDYGQYEKKEILNNDGELTRIQYMDTGNNVVGWETRFYDERIEYSYHFPDDRDHDLEIIRHGSVEKNYMYQVQTEDETIDRMTSIRFNEPGHPDTEENIKIIAQKENGKRDGLNTTTYNSNPTYAIYDMEEKIESYTFKDSILIREMESSHRGSDIEASIKEYYDSGKIKRDFTEFNGKEHGLYTAYYENGKTQAIRNYKNGAFHGVVETFYEDGHTDDFKTYADGKLHGISYGYYSEGSHFLRGEGEYANGLENGVFKTYSNKGSLNMEVEFKDGLKHGIFKDYIIDDEVHTSSYHVFGQYNEGKRTGTWEFGRDNITWIEQVYYEEDIKVWTQYSDSNVRTFYKPNGEIDHTEVMD